MHLPEAAFDAVLPLSWTPTRGNDIPPYAVPLGEGPNGPLYIARGSLGGETHIGTTSHASSQGARLCDGYGRNHAVFEYEVLTCASRMRFHLDGPQSLMPAVETTTMTPQLHVHRDVMSPTGVISPSPRTPARLTPFIWPGRTRGEPAKTASDEKTNEPPPYTAPIGGWVEAPKHSQPVALSGRENIQFEHLARSKSFVLIDDTTSASHMQYSWPQTRAALAGLIDTMSSNSKWEGFDVRFLHHAQGRTCVKTREEFESVFNSVTMWRGDKVMTAKVAQVFEESLPLISEARAPRPVNLLVITDGIAVDTQELFDAMVYFCEKLNRKSVASHMFRIHLLQMGEDRKAIQPLHNFRDRVTQRDPDRRMLNVVSFHRGRGALNAQNIFKLLLASTHISVEEDPSIGERLPAEVIGAQFEEVERIRRMGKI